MSNKKRLYVSHFSARHGAYNLACMKRWAERHGVNWDHFLKNGLTVQELRGATAPEIDQDAETIISFVNDNDLWDLEKLAEFRRKNNT